MAVYKITNKGNYPAIIRIAPGTDPKNEKHIPAGESVQYELTNKVLIEIKKNKNLKVSEL